MDHDQRFKALIREFFSDFMRLFFPQWADYLDLDSTAWVEQEVLPNPPEGSRHVLDLVAQLRTRNTSQAGQDWFVLVHIEIESPDKTTLIKPRLPSYYIHLREARGLPVLPIVLYLRVGMDGIGVDEVVEEVGGFEVLRLRYHYIGLPSLDALQYLEGDNWLGVALAALMKMAKEQAPQLGAQALRRLADAPLNDFQRFLLSDCVQAYLPLDEAGREEFERITQAEVYSKVQAMNKTPYDRGIEQGIELGSLQTLRAVATALLESKFQSVAETYLHRIQKLSAPALHELVLKIPQAATLESLFPPSFQ